MAKKPVMIGMPLNSYKINQHNSGKYQVWEMICLSCGQKFTNKRSVNLDGKTNQIQGHHLYSEGCNKTDTHGKHKDAIHYYRKESSIGDGFPVLGASEGVAKMIGYCD